MPEERPFTFAALLYTLRLRQATVWITVGACVFAAVTLFLVQSRHYGAESILEVSGESVGALQLLGSENTAEQMTYAVTLATQAKVLSSDTLALTTIRALKLEQVEDGRKSLKWLRLPVDTSTPLEQSVERRTRALKLFRKKLTIEVLGGTRMLRVRYVDPDPVLASAVVNAHVSAYLDQYFETRYSATQQASDVLARKLNELKLDVERSQQAVAEYTRKTGILGESETNNIVMAKLEELNKQLSAAEANRITRQAVWEVARSGDPELISALASSSAYGTNAASSAPGVLPSLRLQEAQLKAEIALISARVGPNFPKLVEAQKQLQDLQNSIAREIRKIGERAGNDYTAAKNAEDLVRSLFEQQKRAANVMNDSAVQLGILRKEADANRDLYQGLLAKLKQAEVIAGIHASNIIVVDPARPSASPERPRLLLNLCFGLFVGITGGVGLALLQDSMDRTLHMPQDIQDCCGMRTLGILPNTNRGNPTKHESQEHFRFLRTSLLGALRESSDKVIAVLSPLPNEGKTTVAVGLSRSLAQQGKSVLLVDADLRRPRTHEHLHVDSGIRGLATALMAEANVESHVFEVEAGLHLLPAGATTDAPAELLGSPLLTAMLSNWRRQYDHIVVDLPPLLSFADAAIFLENVDAALLVARSRCTTRESLQRSLEVLEQSDAKVPGVVLNDLHCDSIEYTNHYGHSYSERKISEYSEA